MPAVTALAALSDGAQEGAQRGGELLSEGTGALPGGSAAVGETAASASWDRPGGS